MRVPIASTNTHIQHGDIEMDEDLKLCARCGLVKPTKDFNRNKWKKDGLQHYCRDAIADRLLNLKEFTEMHF